LTEDDHFGIIFLDFGATALPQLAAVNLAVTPDPDAPPVILPIGNKMLGEAGPYTSPTPLLSSGTPPITWSLVNGPGGMTIDGATGIVSWPNPPLDGSSHTITIRAENSWGSDEESWQLSLPRPPEVLAIGDETLEEGAPYIGSRPGLIGTLPVTWSLVNGPGGMTIDSATGRVSWPDPTADGSPHTVTIQATNNVGSDDESWLLTVISVPLPAIILHPSALVFRASEGIDPDPQVFMVQNATTGGLGWTATVETQSGGDWLSVSPASGVTDSTLTATAASAGLPKGAYTGTVTVAALPGANVGNSPQVLPVGLAVDAPVVGQNGVINGASLSKDAVVSPGSIASLFGTNLATETRSARAKPLLTTLRTATDTALTLPFTLAGTQVLVNGIPAALFFVSPAQINFQMPSNVSGPSVELVVVSNGVRGLASTVEVAPEVPGIFTINQQGSGQGAILNGQGRLVDGTAPAAPGEVVLVFCTGLGITDPQVPSGQPAPGEEPLARVVAPVEASVGGLPAAVLFAGLAPGFVGLYQVNVKIPAGVEPGPEVPLALTQNGVPSNTVTVTVQ
ncbi:MAG: hypothetical protein O7A06_02940, partial [Acidobacteria bacterium]|nr:hypothetical protein [Acidobacteriota bacterium]